MKYGLIYYRDTDNLGDDILSYAGRRFLPKVDYYIDRESMDVFVPKEKESVAAILNGWYIHYSYAFPPSPYLAPLWIGARFNCLTSKLSSSTSSVSYRFRAILKSLLLKSLSDSTEA